MENAENAQDEEARNPLPIDDRKDTLDDASAQQPEACTAARPQHVKRSDNTGNDYTIDTDNDYTIDDTATAHFLFLIPPLRIAFLFDSKTWSYFRLSLKICTITDPLVPPTKI